MHCIIVQGGEFHLSHHSWFGFNIRDQPWFGHQCSAHLIHWELASPLNGPADLLGLCLTLIKAKHSRVSFLKLFFIDPFVVSFIQTAAFSGWYNCRRLLNFWVTIRDKPLVLVQGQRSPSNFRVCPQMHHNLSTMQLQHAGAFVWVLLYELYENFCILEIS